MANGNPRWPERDETDGSLRTERERTDKALLDRRAAVEAEADSVIHRAREQADAVVDDAREKVDEELEQDAGHDVTARATLEDERDREDEVLRQERSEADELLQKERAENARILARLLPLERDETDRHLLTERSRSDVALSNRDDFLGIVTHDLRNLLGGIVMSASSLADRAADDEEAAYVLVGTTRIQRYAARMNRLIGDLVDVVSIEAGKLAMHAAPTDAARIVDEIVDTFQAAATAKGVTLRAERPDALPASLDRDRLLQVLANLVTNALKFTAAGGTVVVIGEVDGDTLQLSVVDSGAGIPPDMLESVFERFWQVGGNDRRGLGLGLYISRCIVTAHEGTIRAESTPGKGSRFICRLPLVPTAPPGGG
jgi:signal transduction histidine kinase